jgi:large subunit ribosomal protein L20
MSYSAFMNGMVKANIGLNRKALSELAISHPAIFDEILAIARAAAGGTAA